MNISTFCDIVITNGVANFILVTIRNSEKITRQGKQMALCSLTNYKRAVVRKVSGYTSIRVYGVLLSSGDCAENKNLSAGGQTAIFRPSKKKDYDGSRRSSRVRVGVFSFHCQGIGSLSSFRL